ncbi:cysteine/glutathione ABC transporter ATP-binding protein/permease CydC [Orbaceae bacterium ac157xtp]
MIKLLLPIIKLYRHYLFNIILGMILVLFTLMSSLFLLSLSGWFLAATSIAGVAGLYTFNYMLPAAGVRGSAIIRTVSRYFERLVNHNTTFKILAHLRLIAFNKILPLSREQLNQYQKADLLNRFIADIDNLDHLYLKLFAPIIGGLLMTLILFLALSQFDPTIALTITLILLLSLVILPVLFYFLSRDWGALLAQQKSDYRQKLNNYLQGQAELIIFQAQSKFRNELNEHEHVWLKNQTIQARLASLSSAFIILIIGFITLTLIWLLSDNALYEHQPLIALFIFVGLSSVEILSPISQAFIFLGQVLTSAKRMNQLMTQEPTITFPTKGTELTLDNAQLTFSDVSFRYPNQPFAVFEHLNLTVNQNEHVALIGKTGCGKSTLLNLVTRFWEPIQGKILLNNVDISTLDEPTLRKAIAFIPQVIHIFNDTLRSNLLIANSQASDEQLITVLKQVHLDKLLCDAGLNQWLGENGRALSGGEKRRIGIARALLHNAPLVLMDEPTESLDKETEQQIVEILQQTYHHKTVVMVTHRLINHPFFDRTLQLDNGLLNEVKNNPQ